MQLFQKIIDRNMHQFIFWTVLEVIVWLSYLVCKSAQAFFQNRAILKMNHDLRMDMAETILNKQHQEFHQQQSGEYLSLFTNDIYQIEELAWKPFFTLTGLISLIVFSIIALATLHWSLVVTSLFTALVMIVSPNLFKKKMEQLGKTCTEMQAEALSQLKDLLMGYDVLKLFGRTTHFFNIIQNASEQIERPKYRRDCFRTLLSCIIGAFGILCEGCVDALIGILSIRGVLIQSALLGGGNMCSTVSHGLRDIASICLSFSSVTPYFKKIEAHHKEDIHYFSADMPPLQDCITLDHVSYQYSQTPVLDNLNLSFCAGKKYAVTGASGSGKSTLLKILLGWLPDYKGNIYIDGRNAKSYTTEQIQRQISYIEQNVFLFNTSIRNNITLGESYSEQQLAQALCDSALAGDLESMPDGLDTVVGEEGNNLSGGQKQRVAIARALIHNCSILLVDEGTSALDPTNADTVELSLLSNPNLTLILVSHHLSSDRKKQFDRVYNL
jgi:ATP-binding cassette subfamily B protein